MDSRGYNKVCSLYLKTRRVLRHRLGHIQRSEGKLRCSDKLKTTPVLSYIPVSLLYPNILNYTNTVISYTQIHSAIPGLLSLYPSKLVVSKAPVYS